MITIITKTMGTGFYYDFTLIKNDTGHFKVTPKINGEPYVMQEGDTIDFKISATPDGTAFLTLVADNDGIITLTSAQSETISVGEYYCDITLNYANGDKDTFIKIPTIGSNAIANFHVVYGV